MWVSKRFKYTKLSMGNFEKWKSSLYKGKAFGKLLTDLSKAFDCLSHELIMAKSNAYWLSLSALKLTQSYLSERKQIIKINQVYSSWEEIIFGVPQEFILGPTLFNIFLSDLFLTVQNVDFANYADGTIYDAGSNIDKVIFSLKNPLENFLNSLLIIKWKLMKANVI